MNRPYITGHLGRALSDSALGLNGEMTDRWDQRSGESLLGPVCGRLNVGDST